MAVTNEWVRHADTKTGVTLAFVGATVTALFTIVKDEDQWTCLLRTVVGLSALALVCAVGFAYAALFPRTKGRLPNGEETDEDAVNLLFFGDIAGHYSKDRPSYLQVLSLLTSDPTRLTRQVAAQIHENAHIASAKFRYVNRAIIAELVAVGVTVTVAVVATAGW
ncbi:Pycsar system effector family protein [Paenarthrobacter sp. NPDC090517]|uniref:Pycsar system effector family protein n=1 Tax=Paenarthrobacter sp. NPDC090517 TaxID=3364381 RepID=UPI0037F35F60